MQGRTIAWTTAVLATALTGCAPVRQPPRLRVTSIVRSIDTASPGHAMCASFKVTRQQAERYFSLAQQVDANTFHYYSVILPCEYHGTLQMAGKTYQWMINAGGPGRLYGADGTDERFLCGARCTKSLGDMFR